MRHLRVDLPPLNATPATIPSVPSGPPASPGSPKGLSPPGVHFEYRLSIGESLLGTVEYSWTRRWPVAVMAFCLLLAVLGLVFVPELAWLYLTIAIVGIVLASGLLLAFGTWLAMLRDPSSGAPVQVEADVAGVRFRMIHAASTLEWAYFGSVRRTRHFLMLMSPAAGGVIIPLRAMTPDQASRIEQWAGGPLHR